jgi:prefoldin subunit 5
MATTRAVSSAVSRGRRAAYGEIKRGVQHLEKSIGEIQKGLRDAEQAIEADARMRIRELRKDARAEITALRRRHRDVARILDKLSAAAEGSWKQVKNSADAVLGEAVGAATSLVKRLNKALPR